MTVTDLINCPDPSMPLGEHHSFIVTSSSKTVLTDTAVRVHNRHALSIICTREKL